MSNPANKKDSLDLPPSTSQGGRRDLADDLAAVRSSAHRHSVGSASGSGAEGWPASHISLSTLLGLRGFGFIQSGSAPITTTDKYKGDKARALLMMLLRSQKASEESASNHSIDVHNLVPCGDVAGLLGVTIKQCKDFTPKFTVKHDTYLLIRISIDKIMKCTNPQTYRANKKNSAICFGDVRYFSVKVPKQKSDPRNRISLELVGFESPKDFPRLYGNKQSFTEICAMRIRNMVFCTVEVEFMFCYGCLGYGYSHQLKLPGADPAKAVAYSMFLRVPPPEDRKDNSSNAIKPLRMDYPAFLSPDLNVTVGNFELDKPAEVSEHYKSLQKALKQPPRERLEKLKNEYRSLKTWREKADYLDQLILKRGPKLRPGQTKVSRFKELVGRIQRPQAPSSIYSSSEAVIKEEKSAEQDLAKWSSLLSSPQLQVPAPVPSHEESDSESIHKLTECAEKMHLVLALPVTSSTTCSPGSSDGGENLLQKVVREKFRRESETSLSSSADHAAELSETGDSESPTFPGPESKVIDEELPVVAKKSSIKEYLPEPIQESHSKSEVSVSVSALLVAPKPSDSVVEPVQQWPWKDVFQDAVFSGNKFEPFLRSVGKEQPPPFSIGKADYFNNLEKTYPPDAIKEQEDQDPPYGMLLAKPGSSPDAKLIKSGEQLSILRLIERKMDLEEKDQERDEEESKPHAITSGSSQKPLRDKLEEQAEIKQSLIDFKRSLEDCLVDSLVKVVAVKSLLSKNIENLVAERLSEGKIPEELEDSSSPGDEMCLLEERKTSGEKFAEPDIRKLKAVLSQSLQARLVDRLYEQGIISDTELPEKDWKTSISISGNLLQGRKSLSKERISQAEITTIKSLSDNRSGNTAKTESMHHSKESSNESQLVVTGTSLSESKMDDDRAPDLPLQSQGGSVEGTNAMTDLRNQHSKQSLEIIRVTLPLSTEPDNVKQRHSIHDAFLEKILKAEITSLKSFLSKGLQDHLKDKLSETGLSGEDLETVCWKLSLNVKGEHPVTPEKDVLQDHQVSYNEGLAEETFVVSESVQNLFQALSENEITNLKSVLNKNIQDHLSERLSEIGLITEDELRKILENLFPVVEMPTKGAEGSDLSEEGPSMHPATQNLQDRFSEEELQNLKSLMGRLLKEGHKDQLSESEVKGLTSVLQKSFENLPIQSSNETGISKEVEIKDECHSISLPKVEKSPRVSNADVSDRGKDHLKKSLNKLSRAGEKQSIKRETPDVSVNNIFEVQQKTQETQTMFHPKKVKHSSKRECHRLPGYPDNLNMPIVKTGSFEAGLKSRAPDEPPKRTSEPFATSSFLSVHDIGIQTEIKSYFSKPQNFISKPPFPVNPQTFLFLHSESEEEAKPAIKHQKPKCKKSDRKKDAGSHHPQQAVMNTQSKKDRTPHGNTSKEILKEKGIKHGEPPSPKLSMTENRKDSKTMGSPSGMRKESLKQKSEKKRDNEVKQKKSLSKTAGLANPQLQTLSKNLPEKPSTTKFLTSGRTKGNTLNTAGTDDLDIEAFKHLEKAIERALLDLGRVAEGSSSQGRPNTAPNAAALVSKESSRSFLSAVETPRNQAGSISEMLNNQEQILKMTPEQLEVVLKILQKILKQNTRPQNNG
ncbi:cation channel sperm-associated targeting subunit tau isoform X3 [Rhineura floridana]|uniref:cation channel sperm-associated targeting subunit tau isoform X3 n=1 Tax=Rhineura floridana TaxID=261503 RepID=UPI002AC868B8|nr:cation channel sperm-associated targeting subunit tau isoform X3 [Rhineura floridana]